MNLARNEFGDERDQSSCQIITATPRLSLFERICNSRVFNHRNATRRTASDRLGNGEFFGIDNIWRKHEIAPLDRISLRPSRKAAQLEIKMVIQFRECGRTCDSSPIRRHNKTLPLPLPLVVILLLENMLDWICLCSRSFLLSMITIFVFPGSITPSTCVHFLKPCARLQLSRAHGTLPGRTHALHLWPERRRSKNLRPTIQPGPAELQFKERSEQMNSRLGWSDKADSVKREIRIWF